MRSSLAHCFAKNTAPDPATPPPNLASSNEAAKLLRETMLEITSDDILALSDPDLRILVARLAREELRLQQLPTSSVTAGGHQDASDGGIDVRVDCLREIPSPDFIPRAKTGFQVKKSDMNRSEILGEMCPKGTLRPVIQNLAKQAGAYVIVSAQGSVTDKALADRQKAMREALSELPTTFRLHTDFYDRERLAAWVNLYPGCVAWVRECVGRSIPGWISVPASAGDFLFDSQACLIDERSSSKRDAVSISEGVQRLRESLDQERQCVRLIGQSGTGKTRLVQALFDKSIGEQPLDPALAIYTDYSTPPNPLACHMAADLLRLGKRAILVIDNCKPETHNQLVQICTSSASKLSLLTVEYDVMGDAPEQTSVFRLQAASVELLTKWLKQTFPNVGQLDREKIAEFSDGNFRIARVIANTLKAGETLGNLKDQALFERIFHQRNKDEHLLRAAEYLSLFYSVEVERPKTKENEIGQLSDELVIVGNLALLDPTKLYEALREMERRGVVQSRGRYRAILPQAIANNLATKALAKIHPGTFDQFCATLTPRMLKSVARRIGYLHDSIEARTTVSRWIQPNGPVGDLAEGDDLQILKLLAPAGPDAAMTRIEQIVESTDSKSGFARLRYQWARLIKVLGYDRDLFERAVLTLARLLPDETGDADNVSTLFIEFFHIYLSGTHATPEQKRQAVLRLAESTDNRLRTAAELAVMGLLHTGFFTSSGSEDFGAKSRDWGWHPTLVSEIDEWFSEAIKLAVHVLPDAEARIALAKASRGLWDYAGSRDTLEEVGSAFAISQPWVEGWSALSAALRFDGKKMPADVRARLQSFLRTLRPKDVLNQARALIRDRVPGGGVGWDLFEAAEEEDSAVILEEKLNEAAKRIGKQLAHDAEVRAQFIPELMCYSNAMRAFEAGCGLAEGAKELPEMWAELVASYEASNPERRSANSLAGFLFQSKIKDCAFVNECLDASLDNKDLLPVLPMIQCRLGVDEEGIARLQNALRLGIPVKQLAFIANNCVAASPPAQLENLLRDVADLPEGISVATEILHMYFFCNKKEATFEPHSGLHQLGRDLLNQIDFAGHDDWKDFCIGNLVRACLAGGSASNDAQRVCSQIRDQASSPWAREDMQHTLEALFETQPEVALTAFLLPQVSCVVRSDLHPCPLNKVKIETIREWAQEDPHARYSRLGESIWMIESEFVHGSNEISPHFIELLKSAPDKRAFLGKLGGRIHPRSWSGNFSETLLRRKEQFIKLLEIGDPEISSLVHEFMPDLDDWISSEQEQERLMFGSREQSFE